MHDSLFDYQFDEALDALTCEEEYGDRFDDYRDDEEPKNRPSDSADNWLEYSMPEERYREYMKQFYTSEEGEKCASE